MSASKAVAAAEPAAVTVQKKVLHVGAGEAGPGKLHQNFTGPEWKEIRMDADPKVKPDMLGDLRQLKKVPHDSMDAVWIPHQLQTLHAHEVEPALTQCARIVKEGGAVLVVVPDMQSLGELLTKGRLEDQIYETALGPVAAIDMIYGVRGLIAKGVPRVANHTGFTAYSLGLRLRAAGFYNIQVKREQQTHNLWAVGYRLGENVPNRNEKIVVHDPVLQALRGNKAASDMPDELDRDVCKL